MANSSLSLTIVDGPKAGETLACNPETLIRIGRVVKGNTLGIRDPGISQKHLTVSFLPQISRWVATDLGSSNGTYINGSLIPPEEPSSLSDGDIIKIGEKTSISVTISAPLVLPISDRPPRNGQRGRGRGRKGRGSARVSRKDDALKSFLVEPRVTRSSSARGASIRVSDVAIISNSELAGAIEKEGQSKENNAGVEEEVLTVDGEYNPRVLVEPRVTRSSSARGASIRVLDAVTISNSELASAIEKEEQSKENNAGVEVEVLTVDGEYNSGVEDVEDNMNNMTLGEWFDRMEGYLPNAINKVAEEIIAKLREKAQLFDEYVSQTSNVLVE